MIDDIKGLIREYLFPAFKITNQEIKIYIVMVIFSLVNFSSGFVKIKGIYTLLFLLLQFLAWAFSLSVPFFINRHLEKQKIEYDFMVKKTLNIAKRLIIPGIIFFILTMFLVFVMGGIFVATQGPNHKITAIEIQSYFNSLSNQLISFQHQPLLYLIWIPLTLAMSLFTFQSVFFTLKQRGFFISFIDSLRFSLKNMRFIYLVTIYSLALGLVSFIYPYPSNIASFKDFNLRLIFFLVSLLTQYFLLVKITTATLYFLNKEIKR